MSVFRVHEVDDPRLVGEGLSCCGRTWKAEGRTTHADDDNNTVRV